MSRPLKSVAVKAPARAPAYLSEPSRAWFEQLATEWELGPTELELLRLAAETRDRHAEARTLLDAEGCVLRDRFGQAKAHPATSVERDTRIAHVRNLGALRLEEDEPAAPYEPLALRQRTPRR